MIINLADITSDFFGCQMPYERIFGSYVDSGLFKVLDESIKSQKLLRPRPQFRALELFDLDLILRHEPVDIKEKKKRGVCSHKWISCR